MEVGAFFGAVAGIIALLIVLGWWLVTRIGGTAVPVRPLLVLHLVNVVIYAVCGVAISLLWSRRHSTPMSFLLWLLGSSVAALTVVSVVAGPFWRWSAVMWGKYALTAVGFTFISGWRPRRARRSPAG